MATRSPAVSYAELAAALLSTSEVVPRARLIAQQVAQFLPACAVVVYTAAETGSWIARATEGEVAFSEAVINAGGTLGMMRQKREPVLFAGSELAREAYAHLNIRRTLVSLAAIPLLVENDLVGAIEWLSFGTPITSALLASLGDLLRLAAMGLAAGAAYEAERNSALESVSRVTQLYDLEKVFNSTLEMDDLVPVIAGKFRELLEVEAVNLWLVEDDRVRLVAQAGDDPTVDVDRVEGKGDGIAGDLSDSGESLLIADAQDPRLAQRHAAADQGRIFSLMAAPIFSGEFLVGVVEAVNPLDGAPFDEDALFLLQSICETAAGALHNASLLQAERKVEVLETLVKVSQEITSTLDLERVLASIVNGPAEVIPYERAAIALEQRGKLQLRAMTGTPQVVPDDPNVRRLQELLEWASLSPEPILITQHGEEIEAAREEERAKFAKYFAESGMRAFHAVPLADDDGRVGILSFESSDPDFLTTAHLEMIKILAGQATVALRNASLYREVPFINVLEPVLQKKRKFLAMEKQRRRLTLAAAAAVLVFLAVFPLPLRVDGDAQVAPARTAHLEPEVEGVVRQVYVREGDPVRRGTILASLEDWEYRAALAAAQAKYETAVALMNKALAGNDGTEAGIQRVQADYWGAEVARARERLERTNLRSPIDGVVATPHVQDEVGRQLKFGDNFADVVDTSQADVDVAVDERDVALVQEGQGAAVKLDGYPTRTFRGQVSVVSPRGEMQAGQRVFLVRVTVPNPQGLMRAGMQGRSKVSTGWRPAGVVLFRHSAMWVWSKLWEWLGW